jgi:hypothetical protein
MFCLPIGYSAADADAIAANATAATEPRTKVETCILHSFLLLIGRALERALDPAQSVHRSTLMLIMENRNENVTYNLNTNHSQWFWSLAPI